MAIHSPLHTSGITDDLLHTIYASDQEMYPAPLTYKRLQSWRDACPELSICFSASEDDSQQPVGVIIVLPLLKIYWEDLLVGKIKEVDVDAEEMFAREELQQEQQLQAPVEVGLHVFHIERFAAWDAEDALKRTGARPAAVTVRCGFADVTLEEVRRRVEAANSEAGRRRWDILGFSALTATPAGRKTFARLGFVPTGYKEIFLVNEPNRQSAEGTRTTIDRYMTPETVCIYPGEHTTTHQVADRSSHVVSVSEMTAKFNPTGSH